MILQSKKNWFTFDPQSFAIFHEILHVKILV